eukprot:15443855-Alexandrium_andersonii.AAC.1
MSALQSYAPDCSRESKRWPDTSTPAMISRIADWRIADWRIADYRIADCCAPCVFPRGLHPPPGNLEKRLRHARQL